MPFLRNTWYCAAWATELHEQEMFARKLLGENILFLRKENGDVAAMSNACPHRFAPLHKGIRTGDTVACPYHGLQFNTEGACILNPNEGGKIPQAATLTTYPAVEKWGAIWVWMGNASNADEATIPDFSLQDEREGWSTVRGMEPVAANYKLVVDNLMDRTHIQFMHPQLAFNGELPKNFERRQSFEQIGDEVWDYHEELNSPKYPFLQQSWPDAPDNIMSHLDVRWSAPGNMLLDAGTVVMGTDRKVGVKTPMAHIVTPADETSSYYFWSQTRNKNTNNPEVDEKIKHAISSTIRLEDGEMVADCVEMMGTHDLMSKKPVLLETDAAAMRVRRVLDKLITEEQETK